MAKKVKRSKTPTDRQRIEALERSLKAAGDEHRRLREEFRELAARDPLADLRKALKRQARKQAPKDQRFQFDGNTDPDETIN